METYKVAKNVARKARNPMSEEALSRLRNYKSPGCATCGGTRSYMNPFAKCYECKKRFCYDHIFGGQLLKTMKENEPIRDVCDECKKKFGYYNI